MATMSKKFGCVIVYSVLVLGAGLWIKCREQHQGPNQARKGNSMEEWQDAKEIEVEAQTTGAWTLAEEYIRGPATLKIEAENTEWEYAHGKKCTADGDLRSLLVSTNTIIPTAPVGSLIAKIGGSTAGFKDGHLYIIGRMSVLDIDQSTNGPLFLNINDELTGMWNNSGKIKVKIFKKTPSQTQGSSSVTPAKT